LRACTPREIRADERLPLRNLNPTHARDLFPGGSSLNPAHLVSATSTLLLPADVTQEQLGSALGVCERIAARDRSSLYLTSQLFEDRSRYHAFVAMYAVMRLIDDTIDNIPGKMRLSADVRTGLETELNRWEARIRAAFDGHPGADPLDVALAAAVSTFPVPVTAWLNFIQAMRFDVGHSEFSNFAEFLAYAEGATVAPTVIYVFLLTSLKDRSSGHYAVGGFDFETCGRDLGLFAYLAHILRDMARDMRADPAGIIYLSREDLNRHDLNEEALRELVGKGVGDDRWRTLVKDICGRARAMEARGTLMAEAQYSRMPQDCAFILCLIIRIYSDLLRRIEAAPDEVLRGDPIPTAPEKAVLASVARRTGYPLSRILEKSGSDKCLRVTS
jgi:phytoene/squalene synthetase